MDDSVTVTHIGYFRAALIFSRCHSASCTPLKVRGRSNGVGEHDCAVWHQHALSRSYAVINTEFLTACPDSQLGPPRCCIPLVLYRSCPATCSPYIFARAFCHEFSTRPTPAVLRGFTTPSPVPPESYGPLDSVRPTLNRTDARCNFLWPLLTYFSPRSNRTSHHCKLFAHRIPKRAIFFHCAPPRPSDASSEFHF